MLICKSQASSFYRAQFILEDTAMFYTVKLLKERMGCLHILTCSPMKQNPAVIFHDKSWRTRISHSNRHVNPCADPRFAAIYKGGSTIYCRPIIR